MHVYGSVVVLHLYAFLWCMCANESALYTIKRNSIEKMIQTPYYYLCLAIHYVRLHTGLSPFASLGVCVCVSHGAQFSAYVCQHVCMYLSVCLTVCYFSHMNDLCPNQQNTFLAWYIQIGQAKQFKTHLYRNVWVLFSHRLSATHNLMPYSSINCAKG